MPDQVKLSPSSMQDALGCPRCLVVAHRHGIESENFMPWVGNLDRKSTRLNSSH